MILVDTSVWIDHFRMGDADLSRILRRYEVAIHLMVVGELAMGNLSNRSVLADLASLARAETLPDEDVIAFVERERLHGLGIGFVDAHLLASCASQGHLLWTRDRRLAGVADRLGIAYEPI